MPFKVCGGFHAAVLQERVHCLLSSVSNGKARKQVSCFFRGLKDLEAFFMQLTLTYAAASLRLFR